MSYLDFRLISKEFGSSQPCPKARQRRNHHRDFQGGLDCRLFFFLPVNRGSIVLLDGKLICLSLILCHIPSCKPTYPTLGKENHFQKCLGKGYVSSLERIILIYFRLCIYICVFIIYIYIYTYRWQKICALRYCQTTSNILQKSSITHLQSSVSQGHFCKQPNDISPYTVYIHI